MSPICLHATYLEDIAIHRLKHRTVVDPAECRLRAIASNIGSIHIYGAARSISRNKTNAIFLDCCESSTPGASRVLRRNVSSSSSPLSGTYQTSWQTFRNGILPRDPHYISFALLVGASSDEKYHGLKL